MSLQHSFEETVMSFLNQRLSHRQRQRIREKLLSKGKFDAQEYVVSLPDHIDAATSEENQMNTTGELPSLNAYQLSINQTFATTDPLSESKQPLGVMFKNILGAEAQARERQKRESIFVDLKPQINYLSETPLGTLVKCENKDNHGQITAQR